MSTLPKAQAVGNKYRDQVILHIWKAPNTSTKDEKEKQTDLFEVSSARKAVPDARASAGRRGPAQGRSRWRAPAGWVSGRAPPDLEGPSKVLKGARSRELRAGGVWKQVSLGFSGCFRGWAAPRNVRRRTDIALAGKARGPGPRGAGGPGSRRAFTPRLARTCAWPACREGCCLPFQGRALRPAREGLRDWTLEGGVCVWGERREVGAARGARRAARSRSRAGGSVGLARQTPLRLPVCARRGRRASSEKLPWAERGGLGPARTFAPRAKPPPMGPSRPSRVASASWPRPSARGSGRANPRYLSSWLGAAAAATRGSEPAAPSPRCFLGALRALLNMGCDFVSSCALPPRTPAQAGASVPQCSAPAPPAGAELSLRPARALRGAVHRWLWARVAPGNRDLEREMNLSKRLCTYQVHFEKSTPSFSTMGLAFWIKDHAYLWCICLAIAVIRCSFGSSDDGSTRYFFVVEEDNTPLSVTVTPCDAPLEWKLSLQELPEETSGEGSGDPEPLEQQKQQIIPEKGTELFSYKGNDVEYFISSSSPSGLYQLELLSTEKDTHFKVYATTTPESDQPYPELPYDPRVDVTSLGRTTVTLAWKPSPTASLLKQPIQYCVVINKEHNFKSLCAVEAKLSADDAFMMNNVLNGTMVNPRVIAALEGDRLDSQILPNAWDPARSI
ncbi:PREDICTED: protein NDNF [Propithecus coquereli]|uniref:protein NDNF n=1 Tax=Propithecus coquereli TaxID=379532 RepID=UPI00063FB397|nr:PREDICTED: protein NDNF [Propithecus coquereli]